MRLTVCALVVSMLAPALAWGRVETQAAASAEAAVTDNARGVPDGSGDVALSVGATARAIVEDPRVVAVLGVGVDASKYVETDGSDSWLLRLEAGVVGELSDRTTGGAGVAASVGRAQVYTDPNAPATAVVPGPQTFLDLQGFQTLRHDFSALLRGVEEVRIAGNVPLEENPTRQRAFSAELSLSGQRIWKRDVLGVSTTGAVFAYAALDPLPARRDLFTTLRADLSHAFGDRWTGSAGAGAGLASSLDDPDPVFVPVATLELRYQDEATRIALSAAHTARANLLVAQTLVTDEVALGGDHGFGALRRFSVSASVGYSRGTILDGDAHVHVLRATAAATYRPREWLSIALSHDLAYQDAEVSFTRNVTTLSLTAELGDTLRREKPASYKALRDETPTDSARD